MNNLLYDSTANIILIKTTSDMVLMLFVETEHLHIKWGPQVRKK